MTNSTKDKTYSTLLITSLSIGMSCAILLGLYVYDELSFDRYHKNADSIYRINLDIKWDKNQFRMAHASSPFAPALQAEYPEIINTLRVKSGSQIFRVGNKTSNVKSI